MWTVVVLFVNIPLEIPFKYLFIALVAAESTGKLNRAAFSFCSVKGEIETFDESPPLFLLFLALNFVFAIRQSKKRKK